MKNRTKIAVIGAGASGMMAAVTAAGCGGEVTLFEKNERVGKKILSTGNGKCNLGNLNFSVDQYYCKDKEKLSSVFERFSVWDSIAFFENTGLMIKDRDGYLYPYSEQASGVLDVLRMELVRRNVNVVTDTEITEIQYHDAGAEFEVTGRNKTWFFEKLILACGSPASLRSGEGMTGYQMAACLGHHITPLHPGLVQLRSADRFIRSLAGVRCRAGIQLLTGGEVSAAEAGELQFTDYGISGIPVFQLSRIAASAVSEGREVKVLVDFFPDQDEKTFLYMSRLRYEAQKDKVLENYLTGTLNKKINQVLIRQSGLDPKMTAADIGWTSIWGLMQLGRSFEIHIDDVNSMANAQVCAGGVDLSQISSELESRLVKGLYFAGEILDVDGKCGGYNLQWAWSSGYVAGRSAAGIFWEEGNVNTPESEMPLLSDKKAAQAESKGQGIC